MWHGQSFRSMCLPYLCSYLLPICIRSTSDWTENIYRRQPLEFQHFHPSIYLRDNSTFIHQLSIYPLRLHRMCAQSLSHSLITANPVITKVFRLWSPQRSVCSPKRNESSIKEKKPMIKKNEPKFKRTYDPVSLEIKSTIGLHHLSIHAENRSKPGKKTDHVGSVTYASSTTVSLGLFIVTIPAMRPGAQHSWGHQTSYGTLRAFSASSRGSQCGNVHCELRRGLSLSWLFSSLHFSSHSR